MAATPSGVRTNGDHRTTALRPILEQRKKIPSGWNS
jgi:hypothetical protein